MAPIANCTQRRQKGSHNSLGMSYCQIPAKGTGILQKTSALIAERNKADREVPACFARGGTGRYGALKVKLVVDVPSRSTCEDVKVCVHRLLRLYV